MKLKEIIDRLVANEKLHEGLNEPEQKKENGIVLITFEGETIINAVVDDHENQVNDFIDTIEFTHGMEPVSKLMALLARKAINDFHDIKGDLYYINSILACISEHLEKRMGHG